MTSTTAVASSEPDTAGGRNAGRAIGAMFFSVFGGLWLLTWALNAMERPAAIAVACAAISVAIFAAACKRLRRHLPALRAGAQLPENKRRTRAFHAVNLAQWLAIFAAGALLSQAGLSVWFVPAVILIVGVHFLPLAKLFESRAHVVTGVAMIVVALVYPSIAVDGPASPLGCLGAGITLWASALWALWATRANRPATVAKRLA